MLGDAVQFITSDTAASGVRCRLTEPLDWQEPQRPAAQSLQDPFGQYSHGRMSRLPLHTPRDGGLTASLCCPLCLQIVPRTQNHVHTCVSSVSPWVLFPSPFNVTSGSCFLEDSSTYLFSLTTWPLKSHTGLQSSESSVPCTGPTSQEMLKQLLAVT